MITSKKIPVEYYLFELKLRLFYIIISSITTFLFSYYYSEQILLILATPLSYSVHGYSFIYTNLTEAFLSYLKISYFISLLLTFPIILINI